MGYTTAFKLNVKKVKTSINIIPWSVIVKKIQQLFGSQEWVTPGLTVREILPDALNCCSRTQTSGSNSPLIQALSYHNCKIPISQES